MSNDPILLPDFDAPQMVPAGDVTFAVYEAGPKEGVPLILLHGWPELAYTWKNTIPALARAGYRVIAPDMIGFGRSSCPLDKDQYNMRVLTNNLTSLLDSLALEKAVFIGHDWGSATVWPMGYLHPERVMGIAGICVPNKAPAPIEPLKIFEQRFTGKHYFIEFQDETLPDRVFGGQEKKFFEFIFRKPASRNAWPKLFPKISWLPTLFAQYEGLGGKGNVMSAADRQVFEKAYEKTGHHACTNYYRNMNENWQIAKDVDITVHAPSLMVGANLDAMCPPELFEGMEEIVPDLETHILKDCGHWVMWEQPEALNKILMDWLQRRFPT